MSVRLSVALSIVNVCRSLGKRTGSKTRFTWERWVGLRREKARLEEVGMVGSLREARRVGWKIILAVGEGDW